MKRKWWNSTGIHDRVFKLKIEIVFKMEFLKFIIQIRVFVILKNVFNGELFKLFFGDQ